MFKREPILALLVGLLFAVGLSISGMTQPAKVIGFFDFHLGLESWDPSLALVMGGGVLVYLPVYRWVSKRGTPLYASTLKLPTNREIDVRLIGGAALFGIGWGLGGFCPGPALTSVGAMSWKALVMVIGMGVGMFAQQAIANRPLRNNND